MPVQPARQSSRVDLPAIGYVLVIISLSAKTLRTDTGLPEKCDDLRLRSRVWLSVV
jgi:hypothetical protein